MKKINLFATLPVALILLAGPGCTMKSGSGNIVTETRVTGPFKGLKVSGDFDVEIKKGDKESVILEADDNLINNIETEVKGNRLIIRTTDKNLRNAHFKVYIITPSIDHISASASASVDVKDILSAGSVEFDVSSAGDITAPVDAPEVNAEASSAGVIRLTGRTRELKVNTSSGAKVIATELLSEKSVINSSSGATARVHASVSLDASASSGAEVFYHGGANVRKSVSSGGEVKEAE